MMQDFKRLKVWQAARRFTRTIYATTAGFPVSEQFGLAAQMRKAAVSVCSNIAEGCGRRGDRELKRFLRIGMGSVCEIESELILSRDLGFIPEAAKDATLAELDEIRWMLTALMNTVAANCSTRRQHRARSDPQA